ncbi:MAG TPA: prolipoprotein diacylglyceryl transferase [Acidimicrobiia bacterium]|nr:prolipoprotein diacylglyceryl transferase [Acidimicrobiia bacterium]
MPPALLGYLRYDPLVRIHLGPLSISPHGMGIAVGFLLGSYFFLGWCRKAGLTDDQVYSLVNRAAVGSIVGARLAYCINHPADFNNPLEIFAVWKGGISLLGGITGAVLAGVPKMRHDGLSFWKVMDMAVPCVTMGIIVGRIGDLVIADHLGKPTHFFLGYVCPAKVTGSPCLAPIGQAVHQPALYDFFSAILLLLLLLRLRRTPRYDGFLTLVFGAWYGTGRLIEDFFRVDVTHGTGLTGSQWTAVTVLALCLFCLLGLKDTPWRSGRGAFASIPARYPSDEPVLPEAGAGAEVHEPVVDVEPMVEADQPKEDAE